MDIPYQTLFQAIIEQSGEGIALANTKGNYILVNPTFCQMTGYHETELLGMKVQDLMPPQTESMIFPKVMSGQTARREMELVRKDQSRFLAEIMGYPVQVGEQKLVLGIVRDVTLHRQNEAQVQRQRRQTEHLHQTIEHLTRAQSLEEFYDIAITGILKVLQADRASILLFAEDQRVHFKAWQNLSPAYRQKTDGHSPWQIHETDAQPVFYTDVVNSDIEEELKAAVLTEGIGALLFVPLSLPDRLLGKFMVYFNTPHNWSDQELQVAQVIAQNLAAAINRLQAMAEMERVVTEMQASEENVRQLLQEREKAALALEASNQQLQTALVTLKATQEEMVQRERLAAVGQRRYRP